MILEKGSYMTKTIDPQGYIRLIKETLGTDAIEDSADSVGRYGEHTLPAPDTPPAAVLLPASTEDVQTMVKAAARFGVQVFPISGGQNIGLGSRSPMRAGQFVMDLGRRMNRVVHVDETLAYCVLEPGVTFRSLYEELERRGSRLMASVTAGPPQGSVMGNALDRGGGSGAYADHFGTLCGMEVVLGNGDILRTGDGGLDSPEHLNWHVSKYSFGPALDGLFTQSNYGVVTRTGVWLMPRPPMVRSFFFTFAGDDDLGEIVDLIRPLKLSNFVPTQIRATNDLYLFASHDESPEHTPGSTRSLSNEARHALQEKWGLGAWTVSGAFYGASEAAIAPMLDRVIKHFTRSGRARYLEESQARTIGPLHAAINAYAGIPGEGELRMLRWRAGGGTVWFLPGTPMIGSVANEFQQLSRQICEQYGMDYMVSNVGGPRFARGVHSIVFDRRSPEETARADACYRAMAEMFAARGVFVGRSPTIYQGYHQQQRIAAINNACAAIKHALDPDNVIAPGKYGILD